MGSTINLDEIKRFEVTEVYSHPDAKVDIVLVHGLNGDPRRSWTASNGTFWPTQLLPASLKSAHARILVYGYNADVYTFGGGKGGPSSDMIHQHAQTLLFNLSLERKNAEVSENPIIWVVHSLGGILLKRALELSFDLQAKGTDDLRSIYVSTYGIIFLGTPHNGSQIANFGMILEHMVRALVPRKFMESQSQLIKTLQSNNETLQNINLKFLDIYQHRFKVCMVHETQSTDMRGTKALVVDQASAGPFLPEVQYFGIEATHSGMCKFESTNSPGWVNVSVTIRTWVQEAPTVVQSYWDLEKVQREQILKAQANSIMGIYNTPPQRPLSSPNTPDQSNSVNSSTIMNPKPNFEIPPDDVDKDEPYFIKPNGFRPNSLFVGRQEELSLLHKMLFDKERRAVGTSAVLIQCLPGGGKSHLARQYVYEHRGDFRGGIFWVRAKSEAELIAGFWDIARKAALRELTGVENSEAYREPQVFIKLVKNWLNHRHDWLLVLDGIHFADVDGLQKFIPDCKNTSLIYTSTERSVSGDHHFMNPQIIRLPQLSAVEARELLLLELGRNKPFSQEDLKNAMLLVQAIQFLPVVIHSVAQRLKTTNEPLSKFARTYASQPRLRGLATYTAVVEQLKAIHAEEALNLMHVICFFSQHIPVEMISLGLKALEIPVRASEPDTGRSLNNTFKILNTFALIDRNEQDLTVSSSQSSKGSRDMLAENVDVIRIHSVVQGFFVDTLIAEGIVFSWLDQAVKVFCYSYDKANERITRKTNAGLVEDYRLYEIHGNKLKDHLTKLLSKHLRHEEREVLEDAKELLEERLMVIKSEIDRRTPESTKILAGGKADIALTSIFDRTSSSSDASDTPSRYEVDTRVSTWGIEHEKGQQESPSSILDPDYIRRMEAIYKIRFPLPVEEDPGYESDREGEGSVAMTAQPSQRTVIPELSTHNGSWEEVKYRKPRTRIDRLSLHRTVKNLENSRYHDSAGAYRSLRADDPRLSKETIHGVIDNSPPRDHSRGRISSHSNAVAALAHISKTSPPPIRGGGMIQDKRSLSRGRAGRRLISGAPSYAAAVARGSSPGYVVMAYPDSQSSTDSTATLERPRGSALEALQRFPVEASRQSTSPKSPYTPMPPYPASPDILTRSENPFFDIPGRFSQESLILESDSLAAEKYPRKEGLPPIESYDGPTPGSFQPGLSDSMPASMFVSHSNLSETFNMPFLSLSSPNIALPRESSDVSTYVPGRPELSNLETPVGGYSSQPMSRDPSGQSNRSHHSTRGVEIGGGNRRPSFAETEPGPKLPMFSPKIPPTSYQVYERMKERNLLRERNIDLELLRRENAAGIGQLRKSPQLEYARAALIEKLDDWSVPNLTLKENNSPSQAQPRRKFNPTAPSFSPSNSFNQSPRPPSVPANSMLSISNPTTLPNSTTTSAYPSPFPTYTFTSPPQNTPQSYSSSSIPYPSPQSFNSAQSYSSPFPPQNTPLSFTSAQTPTSNQITSGTGMERSSSGGVKIGPGKMIAFGDYEPVDYVLARERAESLRNVADREREAERKRRATSPANGGSQAPRMGNSAENVGLGIGVQLPSEK